MTANEQESPEAQEPQEPEGTPEEPAWQLVGFNAFSEEWCHIGRRSGYEDTYPAYSAALLDAWRYLRSLEVTQPTTSSGDQAPSGIQDRVWIVHPGGHRERVLPDIAAR